MFLIFFRSNHEKNKHVCTGIQKKLNWIFIFKVAAKLTFFIYDLNAKLNYQSERDFSVYTFL